MGKTIDAFKEIYIENGVCTLPTRFISHTLCTVCAYGHIDHHMVTAFVVPNLPSKSQLTAYAACTRQFYSEIAGLAKAAARSQEHR